MVASGENPSEQVRVLVEVLVPRSAGAGLAMDNLDSSINLPGFQVDSSYAPVTVESTPEQSMSMRLRSDEEIVVVRGTVSRGNIQQLESSYNVIKVWSDPPIEPFTNCPIPPCDCVPTTPKGDRLRAAQVMGASQIWARGYQGQGIVIGIVDGGISAEGRTQNGRIPNVIGGWPNNDWGTRAEWDEHGNMSSTDALAMAPQAQIYDIRVSGGDTSDLLSNALQGFQWAINQYQSNGTPQILSNSWGIYQQNLALDYIDNANHPFNRKVVEAVNAGIIVLFAAGNCGATCPDPRCGDSTGPGRDIWGANGHPLVITVGAVNSNYQLIGYSSSGPAALDQNKPDVCGVSHFTGYFNSDAGTSAACPVVAGVVALLKQANSSAQPAQIKTALQETAAQIGGLRGWNQHSGYGVVQGNQALSALESPTESSTSEWNPNNRKEYFVGDVVSYQGNEYMCIRQFTYYGDPNWAPGIAHSLWRLK
ncbi:MAG: S8 family serine peptidase [Okeania sp. SIO2C9]|uniref:S8 family serine peptidase n=1 Tax=Okeania sp. SIO2C9 TaxID=2607791 RepID=UPI0013BF0285|nr:S8 family serine peptidase [Okeania sp. SIO2C9]NEQ74904.1 S8 family serine peptidase [Okeania sp. SIO2C9]